MNDTNKTELTEEQERVLFKSSAIAKSVGVALSFIIVLIETVFFGNYPTVSMSVFSVCFSMEATEAWYRYTYLRQRFDLVKGILCSVFALGFIVCLIILLLK